MPLPARHPLSPHQLVHPITYQGRLNVPDGAYDFVFRLYDAAIGGTKIGPDSTAADAPVKATAYSVTLNFGANAFNGDARWLLVYYRPGASPTNGAYTSSARVPLLPTAYAQSLAPGAQIAGNVVQTPTGSSMLKVTNTGTAFGIWSTTTSGDALRGNSTTSTGVYGQSGTGPGLFGQTSTGIGVEGTSISGAGMVGTSQSWAGVYGQSDTERGMWGKSTSGAGVIGESTSWFGVYGNSTNFEGVHG